MKRKVPGWCQLLPLSWLFPCLLGAQAPIVVTLDSTLQVNVLLPFARSTTEHVVCLYGSTEPTHIRLTKALVPEQHPITAGSQNNENRQGVSAAVEPCASAIGIWHNHPSPPDSARGYLYFTTTDQHTFLYEHQAMVAFVGVSDGAWCMWTRAQVRNAWNDHLVPAPSVTGQCSEGVHYAESRLQFMGVR